MVSNILFVILINEVEISSGAITTGIGVNIFIVRNFVAVPEDMPLNSFNCCFKTKYNCLFETKRLFEDITYVR